MYILYDIFTCYLLYAAERNPRTIKYLGGGSHDTKRLFTMLLQANGKCTEVFYKKKKTSIPSIRFNTFIVIT